MRTVRVPAVLSLMLAITIATPVTAQPEDVIATRADESDPAASDVYIAWAVAEGEGQDLFVRRLDGGDSVLVNAEGTFGASGGIEGTTLVYQQFSFASDTSDVKLFDLFSSERTDPPPGVNTDGWEYWPSLSGEILLFGRLDLSDGSREIVLFDLVTGASSTLARSSGWRRTLEPGQINGTFAAWGKVVFRHDLLDSCDVYVEDLSTGTITRVPNQRNRCQYASSVDAYGTVYFGRSGFECGANATLMRYPVGGPVEVVQDLSGRTDFGNTFVVDNGDGTAAVYFDPGRCRRGSIERDIRRVIVDVPSPAP